MTEVKSQQHKTSLGFLECNIVNSIFYEGPVAAIEFFCEGLGSDEQGMQ